MQRIIETFADASLTIDFLIVSLMRTWCDDSFDLVIFLNGYLDNGVVNLFVSIKF